jgi:hypothetical protein
MPPINNGLNLDLERAQQDGSEWQFGAFSKPSLVSIPRSEREQYLPIGETQFDAYGDFQDCATRSPINHLEALFTYHYQHGISPENEAWLDEQGYAQNGTVTFSDRFIAKLSGTTHSGNSLKAPLDAIHSYGLIPKKRLPKTDTMTWDDYYAPISQELINLGEEFKRRFVIEYEQVHRAHFADLLNDDMIGVAAHAWPIPVNGIYPETDGPINHAFVLYNLPAYQAYDNYMEAPGDFTKNLSPAYTFFDYGYRVYIAGETTPMHEGMTLTMALRATFMTLSNTLTTLLAYLRSAPPPLPPVPPTLPADTRIKTWALGIQHNEGGKPQDLNTRNKNPGNLKFTPYTASLGAKKGQSATDGGTFCYFDTYEQGFAALCQLLTDACTGNLIAYNPTDTLDSFTTKYAHPPTKTYVNDIAARLQVDPSVQIKSLI